LIIHLFLLLLRMFDSILSNDLKNFQGINRDHHVAIMIFPMIPKHSGPDSKMVRANITSEAKPLE